MSDEELGILELRAVIGVGVDDQLRIRDVLLHDEGVDRGHDHVVTAVHDECWLLDRLQIVVRPFLLDAPLVHRPNLGGRNLVVHLGIAPLLTKMLALQELQSRRLARLGRTEENREPEMLRRIIGGAEDPLCYLSQRLHSLTAARTGADQDQLADEIGRLQRDFLRDHAADREAQNIRLVQTKCSAEGDCVSAHLLERRRDLAGAAGNACVVEQDHLTVASQAIRHRRVPVIHGARVVLVEDNRHAAGLAESAIGEANSVGLDVLRRRRVVGMRRHDRLLVDSLSTNPQWKSLQPALLPPSAARICPVMNDASLEARKMAACAISAGSPTRPRGTVLVSAAFLSELPVKRLSMPVSVGPGAMALTRTPDLAPSSAADFVRPSTACLLAA